MAHLLEVERLQVKFFTDRGTVAAVDNVSFHVDSCEVLGLAGESGCGKSVTCQAVMGLIARPGKITGGSVKFCEQELVGRSEDELRKVRSTGMAMIFQDPLTFLNPVLTVGEQITEVLRSHLGMRKQQARERAIELLQWVGIPSPQDCLNAYPHMFSGGMRQRVMIAIALSCNPKLLIADEPTTALDVTVQLQIIELVKRLQREVEMGVIWISHDLGVLAALADRVNVMYAGHVIESGDVRTLYQMPTHPYTKGLLASIPRLDDNIEMLSSIQGNPPDLSSLGDGCPFLPRCTQGMERCKKQCPQLMEVGNHHQVACWLHEGGVDNA